MLIMIRYSLSVADKVPRIHKPKLKTRIVKSIPNKSEGNLSQYVESSFAADDVVITKYSLALTTMLNIQG